MTKPKRADLLDEIEDLKVIRDRLIRENASLRAALDRAENQPTRTVTDRVGDLAGDLLDGLVARLPRWW